MINLRAAGLSRCMIFFCVLALLACTDSPVGSPDDPDPGPSQLRHGVLSFRVSHNVDEANCIEEWTCFLETNQESDIQQWLARVREDSDLAVLHWNRPIPYTAFATDPPEGPGRVAFYDDRLAPVLVNWIDAFAEHFDQMPRGYLAVSGLNSRRNRPAPSFTGEQEGAPITNTSVPPSRRKQLSK